MTPRVRRSIASVLALWAISLPGALLAKERRGADLDIVRRNGLRSSGELIAVKQSSLLLLNAAGQDVSVESADISSLTIHKKSRATKGSLTGFLIGSVVGGIAGAAVDIGEYKSQGVVLGALVFGIAGGFIGMVAGSASGSSETIDFEKLPEPEVQKAMTRLRGMARMPSAQ